ncbi:MAG: PEP-CTERM sorting domain-containing protein [Proteobacteria bacterium]|nr:PEP-CTERM sorting domain-containing protein [Pseudomonadota bacterium]
MKKIILTTVLSVLLSVGSVMAAGVPGGHEMGDLTSSVKGYGHAGGIFALTGDSYLDQEDSLGIVSHGQAADRGREAWADDFFFPSAYSYHGDDTPTWMVQHVEQSGAGPAVPVPGTILLLGSGVAGLVFARRSSMNNA